MKNVFYCLMAIVLFSHNVFAQQVPVVISGGTIHVGDGTVIENGLVIIRHGNIEYAGVQKDPGYDMNSVSVIDATGKHIYPGMIALSSELGLKEIEAVRATRDGYEVGVYNPNIRSLIAYNTDSKVIPTVRSNGVLLAQPIPNGGVISGQSSVVKLTGWNWEDAVVATDGNMHMHWPGAYSYDWEKGTYSLNKQYENQVTEIYTFFAEAAAYCKTANHTTKNLRFESMREVLNGKQRLFVGANQAKEIIGAVELARTYGLKIAIAGGRQAYRVSALLKEQQVPVLLESTHELPPYDGDPIDLPYRLPYLLHQAGLLVGLTINNEGGSYWNVRNLPFQAGTAAAYGLTKEEALSMVTLNNARIAGIDDRFGTITTGKSATLFISDGDALDMRTNHVSHIFIAGERIKPGNWQDDLSKKYELKYGIQVQE